MSYGRMREKQRQLREEVKELLAQAEAADAAEDAEYGSDRRGDELPADLQRRESRLKRIRETKRALEGRAKDEGAIGQIKQARGFRQVLLRGSRRCKVNGRWCVRRTTFSSCIASACEEADSLLGLDRVRDTDAAIADSDGRHRGRAAGDDVTNHSDYSDGLLDLMMPQLSGESFSRFLSADPRLAAIPILVVSASPQADEESKRMGAVACIHKPVDLDGMLSIIKRYLRTR